tara:strand:- start:10578 stop:10745 length:168 start_codon:yes stop_codon:yes gene_type:complete
MGKKEKNKDTFNSSYTVKGDGVAVLKPQALRSNDAFKQALREMREKKILSSEVPS